MNPTKAGKDGPQPEGVFAHVELPGLHTIFMNFMLVVPIHSSGDNLTHLNTYTSGSIFSIV